MKNKIVISLLIFGLQVQGLMSFDMPPMEPSSKKISTVNPCPGFTLDDQVRVGQGVRSKKSASSSLRDKWLQAKKPGKWAHINSWNTRLKEYDRLNKKANDLEEKNQQYNDSWNRWKGRTDLSDKVIDVIVWSGKNEVKKLRLQAHELLTGNDYSAF